MKIKAYSVVENTAGEITVTNFSFDEDGRKEAVAYFSAVADENHWEDGVIDVENLKMNISNGNDWDLVLIVPKD